MENIKITARFSQGQLGKWYVETPEGRYLLKENGLVYSKSRYFVHERITYITTSNISEVIAYRVGRYLNLPTIPYKLVESKSFPKIQTKEKYLSICKLVPYLNNMADMIEAVENRYISSSEIFLNKLEQGGVERYKLAQLLIFDALIGNEDRHLNNFAINIKDNKYYAMDFILDNGNSLLYNVKPLDIPSLHLERPERIGPDKAKPLSDTHDKQIKYIRRKLGQNKVVFNIYSNIETFMNFLETDPEIQEAFRILNNQIKEQAIKYYLRNRYLKYVDGYVKPTYVLLDIKDKQYLVGNYLTNTKQLLTESEIFNLLTRKIRIENLKLQTNNGKQYIQREKAQITF
jgi:hypothetical protein